MAVQAVSAIGAPKVVAAGMTPAHTGSSMSSLSSFGQPLFTCKKVHQLCVIALRY